MERGKGLIGKIGESVGCGLGMKTAWRWMYEPVLEGGDRLRSGMEVSRYWWGDRWFREEVDYDTRSS